MFISIFKQYLSFKQSLPDYVVRELLNKLFTQGFGYILIIIIYLLLGIFFYTVHILIQVLGLLTKIQTRKL